MGMPIRCVLLRLFLSLTFILNGMGAAMASAHVPGIAMLEAATAGQDASAPPCHQSMQETQMAHEEAPGMADADQAEHPSESGKSGCCKSELCRCTCMHGSQAAIASWPPIATAQLPHVAAVRPLSPAHAAPALPHLIRPPIG